MLGTALGGIASLVGPAGWTVQPSADALAAALPQARAGAAAMAPLARRRYLTTFHPDVVTARLLAVYDSVLSRPPRRSSI